MSQLYDKTVNLVKYLPEGKLNEVYNYLSYLNDKEEWEATYELSSPEILSEIKQGLSDLKTGNSISFRDIKRNV
jgi:hypothetical protein